MRVARLPADRRATLRSGQRFKLGGRLTLKPGTPTSERINVNGAHRGARSAGTVWVLVRRLSRTGVLLAAATSLAVFVVSASAKPTTSRRTTKDGPHPQHVHPALSLRVGQSPVKNTQSKATVVRVTVHVTHAGNSVPGARVTGLPGGAKTSDANGSVVFTVWAGKNGIFGKNGTFTLAAAKAGYAAATAKLVLPDGIFVAPSGSDTTGDGSLSKPFARLTKAQATMRRGGPQITYIRGGYYALPAVTQNRISYGLHLTSADSGQTWSYYPPDGYGSAILDGGSTSSSTGIQELITIEGASHVTIDGLQLQHFRWVGIGLHGGRGFYQLFPGRTAMADSNTVTNNIIHDGSYDTTPIFGYGGGGIYAIGNIPNTTVTDNAVSNLPTSGVMVALGNAGTGGNLTSLRIANNSVLSTCLVISDCGSIYVQDVSARPFNIVIDNNFVRDSGVPGHEARNIYLDDGTSGVTVSHNVSTGTFMWAFTIHGGSNNTISSNIVDLGPSNNRAILLYQSSTIANPMTGNTVSGNVIVSGGAGGRYRGSTSGFGAAPTIKNNAYFAYAGAPIHTGGLNGLNGDASPVVVNPQLSCWTYVLAGTSPVYSAPVSFAPLPRSWGPPGYTVPATGSPPSQPHSC